MNHPKYGKEVKAGKDYWSVLPPAKCKGSLNEIKDNDYGKITTDAPYVPGSMDKETI